MRDLQRDLFLDLYGHGRRAPPGTFISSEYLLFLSYVETKAALGGKIWRAERRKVGSAFNGKKAHVVREPPPQKVVYAGEVEVQVYAPFSYRTTQTIAHGEPALEQDECEAIFTAHNNNAAHAAVDRGDLVRGSKARRLRRLQARSRVAAE
jgi:hypothetical protein